MKQLWKISFAILVLVVIFLLQRQFADHALVQEVAMRGGYIGVFLFSFLNSFNIFVPIVTSTLVSTWVAAGLSFLPIVFVITCAVTVVDIGFYFLGRFGHGMMAEKITGHKAYAQLKALQEKNYNLPLLICGLWIIVVPIPNEFVTIPLGFLGYRLIHVGSIILIGNFIFNIVIGSNALRLVL